MLHLTLNSNPLGTNLVQINNYVSSSTKGKSGTNHTGSRIPKKSNSVRNHKVKKDVIRRTGYRDTKKLNKYRKILIDGFTDDYKSSKLSKKSTTTTGRKRGTHHSWKTQFESFHN